MAKSVTDQLAALRKSRENAEKALARAKAEEDQIVHALRDKIVGVVRDAVEAGLRANLAETPKMDTSREAVKAAAERLFTDLLKGVRPAMSVSAAPAAPSVSSAGKSV